MASANIYEKHYLTKSRTNNDNNIYVLILFKSDNTFVIKKKSNLHGVTEDGLVTIKDRNKSYTGYCLCEGECLIMTHNNSINKNFYLKSFYVIGSLMEIEAAAERLDKEMNTDIESDYEAVMNNNKSKKQQKSNQVSMLAAPVSSNIEIVEPTTKSSKIQKKRTMMIVQTSNISDL
jgi:hypothetical protein